MAKLVAVLCCFLLGVSLNNVFGQENTETNVAPSLQECYKDPELMDANTKIPMTMNVLIDMIRKIENGPTLMDLRTISTSMLHRFRQDGIRKSESTINRMVLPYSPFGHENDKFKIILQNLVPGNPVQFPNETMTSLEKCAMHLMLSEVTELQKRANEIEECRQVGKYQMRVRRDVKDDVEVFIPDITHSDSKSNQQLQPKFGVDSNILNSYSICPLEYGVVYTKWGAVSAGTVISGIAAGTEPQTINIKNIINKDVTYNQLSNIWGATLAGDLAETGYLSKGLNSEIAIGNHGEWDSRTEPHNYYLRDNTHIYMTDAEIRGGLDGLILGKQIEKNSAIRTAKLSQVLDMYYSSKGVFSKNIRACSRGQISKEYAQTEDMKNQATAFGNILNKRVKVQNTIDEAGVLEAINEAVQKFDGYISSLNDLQCMEEQPTAYTDLYIFLDCSWQYKFIYSAISILLDEIDINPYNSNFTLINAQDGSMILNSSYSLLEFHEVFNDTTYTRQPRGFDLNLVMERTEDMIRNKMNNERINPEAGGRSLITMFITPSSNFGDAQKDLVIDRINNYINVKLPDLKLLALTSGSKDIFENIVKDTQRDVFIITESLQSSDIISSITPLVKRIREVPKRLINAKCGADWNEVGNDKQTTQYVEPNGINYHRIHPNYFFSDSTRNVKIRGAGSDTLSVCYSREIEQPKMNGKYNASATPTSSDEVICKQITSEYVIELSNLCSGKSRINECQPLYISVEAPQTTQRFDACKDKACRFPDNLKYTISLDNFGCYSSAHTVFINVFVLISMLCILLFKNNV